MSAQSLKIRIPENLTPQQRRVLELLASGMKMNSMASEMDISVKTVDYHLRLLRKKLRLFSTPELVKLAIRIGLAEIDV